VRYSCVTTVLCSERGPQLWQLRISGPRTRLLCQEQMTEQRSWHRQPTGSQQPRSCSEPTQVGATVSRAYNLYILPVPVLP